VGTVIDIWLPEISHTGKERSVKIAKIEGIGAKFSKTLKKSGVRTTKGLLKTAATKKGRQKLAASSGISEKLILEWVNLADLMRIKGVGEEYSDLLEEAGVDSVKELRNRVPVNLFNKMAEVNAKKRLVRREPSLKEVKKWVAQSKKLKPVVTH
jgi:predicted flap endonuclease-1-like 5' DNA nuclease